MGRNLVELAVGLAAFVVAAAPLAAGTVHRGSLAAAMALAALALGLLVVGTALGQTRVRVGAAAWLPWVLLVLPLLQSVPLPPAVRDAIDPAGGALLDGAPGATGAWRPLSLDPPSTRVEIGKAAAALVVFLIAYHGASGRSRRGRIPTAVAAASLIALVVGLAHVFLRTQMVYGAFAAAPGLLVGPFINPNHTAELLELGAFVALALAMSAATREGKVAWLLFAALVGGGALATLSRGAVLGMGTGWLVLLIGRRALAEPLARSSGRIAAVLGIVGALALAAALGAWRLVTELRGSGPLAQESKVRLWGRALGVVRAHPMGIGRGAFDRVFPAYEPVMGPFRFGYVENEPLQWLVDVGWVGAVVVAAALLAVLAIWRRHARRDAVEVALGAGLVAVLAHNLVDFGLETLGVALPLFAVLGVLLGRAEGADVRVLRRGARRLVMGAGLAAAAGAVFAWAPTPPVWDQALRAARTPTERADAARTASAAHPVDAEYALALATTEPLREGERSPRMQALGRAVRLCPGCARVHREVARTTWALGLRSQALGAWRQAVTLAPASLPAVIDEMTALAATPAEIADLGGGDSRRMLALARALAPRDTDVAAALLEDARALGAAPAEVDVALAEVLTTARRPAEARSLLARAGAALPGDPRVLAALAATAESEGQRDEALALLDKAARLAPDDVALQARWARLALAAERWTAFDAALDAWRRALALSGRPLVEAHVASARASLRRGMLLRAVDELKLALAQAPDNVSLWWELAEAAESIRPLDALEAYREVARRDADFRDVKARIARLEARRLMRSP